MRRRAIVIIFCLACFVGIICFLGYKIIRKQNQNEMIKITKEYLPAFEFYQLDSSKFSSTSINKNNPLIIIHFNTACEHCQAEAQLIHQNIKALKKSHIIMVAPNSPLEISSFIKQYGISQYPEIIVLWDKESRFVNWFGPSPFPSIYIYDRAQHLVKEYHGEVKIEAITKYLN
jgi:thiol-disulfide isomerase/thioredoxin